MAAELRSFPNPMYNSRLPGEMVALRPSRSRRSRPSSGRDCPLKATGKTDAYVSHSARHLEKQSMKKLIMNFAPMLLALMFVSPVYSKGAGSTLRIVRDSLLESGNFYFVKGAIYNPNSMAVKNVVIKYYVWKNGWDRMVMASASSRLAAWSWRTSNTSLRSKPWNSPLRAVTMRP